MTIIYIFYVEDFIHIVLIWIHTNNHILIVFLRIIILFNIHILCIYPWSYHIIFKINVSLYWTSYLHII